MRLVETIRHPQPIRLTPERRLALETFLDEELSDAKAARIPQEQVWREALRLYEGVPKQAVRNVPIENAPNVEVVLGASTADSVYAQAIDLVYTISPIVTAQATDAAYAQHTKAFQRLVTWGTSDWGMRAASDHVFLDDVQLGTGVYFVPFVERLKKTTTRFVRSFGPTIQKVPPEDFFVPGGADADLQAMSWCAMRTWLTPGEFADQARALGWHADLATPAGVVGWVRSTREQLGRTSSSKRVSELYEIFRVYCYFDIDGDGYDEDLLVIWDDSAHKVLKAVYNPFDHRPFEAMRYQLRGHLFYGIGVVEMVRAFQEGATEIYNDWVLNSKLANTRMFKTKRGQAPVEKRIWPGRWLEFDDPDSMKAEVLADTYPSAPQALAATISMAERRAGINELSMPRPSQVLGSRTPGITALSLLQQVNRRFTPAFDGMRLATSGAIRQCLYRFQERLLSGDLAVEDFLRRLLGTADAGLVVELLRRDDFDEAMTVQLTASSASLNRDADRQNAILLVNVLGQYYQRLLELSLIASRPDIPPPVRDIAMKIATAAGEIIDRTIRTFDQIRDPATFVIRVEDALDTEMGPMASDGTGALARLLGVLGGGAGGGAGNGAQGALMG